MLDVATARRLLDFNARIDSAQRAEAQLEGAVAIHNLLDTRGVAYLADEVGMGKTYVALGALAIFRHFQPNFRVLVIAPRENIQRKWMKEMRNFVTHNVRFPDLRVKSLDGRPARSLVMCHNLLDLVREASLDRNRDFFVRLTSYSLAMPWRDDHGRQEVRRLRDGLRRHLPWMADEVFDLRDRHDFKDNFARAVCCSLPDFDLVIVDEAHNLKHGFGDQVASRNRVLGTVMGHPEAAGDRRLFRGYGPRATRVLFLSATPVEESYLQLWNQLHVFDKAGPYAPLVDPEASEDRRKQVAGQFLIRRVTEIRAGGVSLTKNQYRREWRRGGVADHDEPIRVEDPKHRLIVALIQKKVGEILGNERFNSSFQVGMLASFESFLETAKVRTEDDAGNFDDTDQTDDALEREGIDVAEIDRFADSYRRRFGREMPHPKMDALVAALEPAWRHGRKALVFVRRVASVGELKRKLDERYDDWLFDRLRRDLPEKLHGRLDRLIERYRKEKGRIWERRERPSTRRRKRNDRDHGGHDTFFAWFFRGERKHGVVSGATIQQRLGSGSGVYGTLFKDNHVAAILGCRPGTVRARLASLLGVSREAVEAEVRERSREFLGDATTVPRGRRFDAAQAAALRLLIDSPATPPETRQKAETIWVAAFAYAVRSVRDRSPDVVDMLETDTFFSGLRHRPALRAALWPEPMATDAASFHEQELRACLLASASRFGHSLVDLYVLVMRRLGSLRKGAQEDEDAQDDHDAGLVGDFLDLLERQMHTPRGERGWGAFDELSEIAAHFDLILDVNEPAVRGAELREAPALFAGLLRGQQPVGGMSGQVNQTLVRQFRMPGYPFILVSTDLLQEGEDLHTFCSAVHHYGISWTPSSMEQRTGRIDRVRSASDRRLSTLEDRLPNGDEKLQVYYPHLEDTVEVLQVQRVLERMNTFLRLMHEGLTVPRQEQRTINVDQEFAAGRRAVPRIEERLQTAFPIEPWHLAGERLELVTDQRIADELRERFRRIADSPLDGVHVDWEPIDARGQLAGTVRLQARQQPFTLLLRSIGSHPLVRCVSPVGSVGPDDNAAALVELNTLVGAKIGAFQTDAERSYDLTVEGEVLLAEFCDSDATRIGGLIRRVTGHADEIEREHLGVHVDRKLAEFRDDLLKEAGDEE
jgi:hypothetical protein